VVGHSWREGEEGKLLEEVRKRYNVVFHCERTKEATNTLSFAKAIKTQQHE
jgi:hypothetical protein